MCVASLAAIAAGSSGVTTTTVIVERWCARRGAQPIDPALVVVQDRVNVEFSVYFVTRPTICGPWCPSLLT